MFKRKKMSETDPLNYENEAEEFNLPINDKRRFNEHGERIDVDANAPVAETAPLHSAKEIALEAQLKAEVERREAAEAKLVGVQAKFDEAKAGLEKETADLRARLVKTLEDRANQSKFNFLITLLPVLDNLNLAVSASEQDASVENLRVGVAGVARSFEQALASVGVVPVASVDENFDPELHEAVDLAPVEAERDGKIVKEYSKGYLFGERLLRAARVQVGKGVTSASAE